MAPTGEFALTRDDAENGIGAAAALAGIGVAAGLLGRALLQDKKRRRREHDEDAVDALFEAYEAQYAAMQPIDGDDVTETARSAARRQGLAAEQDTPLERHPTTVVESLPMASSRESWRTPVANAWLWLCLLVTGGCLLVPFITPSHDYSASAASLQTKSIEEIVAGDLVLAKDPETNDVAPRRVLQTFRRVVDHLRILQVRSADGSAVQEIKTTDEHPIWVEASGWVEAGKLRVGHKITQADGLLATVVASVYEPHPEGYMVFNFEVEGYHTYFVAENGIRGPPLLVHNNNPCIVGYGPKPVLTGPPSSVVHRLNPRTGMPVQNQIFDADGKVIGHVDFPRIGNDIGSLPKRGPHGHRFPPGQPGLGHGPAHPHIDLEVLPPGWSSIVVGPPLPPG